MEGKTSKYSISAWRKNAKEKRNISKRQYYKKNREKLAEKARERMKRLCEKRKLQSETDLKGRGSVATRASAKERKSREKRAAQVRARKMERKREEEREELRKQHRRRQTKDCVRNYREKQKLADDQARPELEEECMTPNSIFFTDGYKKGQREGDSYPTRVTQEKIRGGSNFGKQSNNKTAFRKTRIFAIVL